MYFSNSLIIQKPKTKEIMHRDVFGSENPLVFASLISPSKSVCLRSYNIKTREVRQKMRRIFNPLLGV